MGVQKGRRIILPQFCLTKRQQKRIQFSYMAPRLKKSPHHIFYIYNENKKRTNFLCSNDDLRIQIFFDRYNVQQFFTPVSQLYYTILVHIFFNVFSVLNSIFICFYKQQGGVVLFAGHQALLIVLYQRGYQFFVAGRVPAIRWFLDKTVSGCAGFIQRVHVILNYILRPAIIEFAVLFTNFEVFLCVINGLCGPFYNAGYGSHKCFDLAVIVYLLWWVFDK
eukprot:TRINITY_DN3586_c0_g1_i10.p3 TRINITY_DN3586_c0_g1~~TRINITY_DN3586_c0_g1_i10.p3  ORF type:complete len:221 (+),score=-39.55 TRINITY_DN3586_c0_g1_i10:1063-1725(+)